MLTLDKLFTLITKVLDIPDYVFYPELIPKPYQNDMIEWLLAEEINTYFDLSSYHLNYRTLSVNIHINREKESIIKKRIKILVTKIKALDSNCIISNYENLVEIDIDNAVAFHYSSKVNESIISIVINRNYAINKV